METMWLVTFLVTCYCATTLAQVVIRETGFSDQYKSENTLGEYTFGYNEDHTTGGSFRRETSDRLGNKIGSYGLRIGDGRVRIVNYVADRNGFRANVFSNEPGVESQNTNHFLKINKGRILGVLVPGFRYSSIAPHVTFESSPSQINIFRGEVAREDGSNLPKSVQPLSIDDKDVVNRYAGKSNPDVFTNEGFRKDDAYSKPQRFSGEGRTNRYAGDGHAEAYPSEAFSGGDGYSKPHSFDGEGRINKYTGKDNAGGFPNEGFRGDDSYSKAQRFDGEDVTGKYPGGGNIDDFPREDFEVGDAYSESRLDSSNMYKTVEGKVLPDPFSNGENNYQSSGRVAPTGISGLQLEQIASATSPKVQKESMHSASISTSEQVNGARRDHEKKDRNHPEISTTFGDLTSFPSTIVVSKQAAEKNATFHEGIDDNDKNTAISTAADT